MIPLCQFDAWSVANNTAANSIMIVASCYDTCKTNDSLKFVKEHGFKLKNNNSSIDYGHIVLGVLLIALSIFIIFKHNKNGNI